MARRIAGWIAYISGLLLFVVANVANAHITFHKFTANLNAPIIILDAASVAFPGTHAPRPLVASADECLNRCKKVAGCNAYTYCNKREGCGVGCLGYGKNHPTLQSSNGPNISPGTKLPILSFGPFSSDCSGDKWPYGMCSLKASNTPSNPAFYSTDAAEGWVSGTIVAPSQCKGVSANTCGGCLKSSDPAGCLSCARSMGDERLAQIMGNADVRSTGCPACFSWTSGQKRANCVRCLKKNLQCKSCILEATKPHTVSLCLDCFNREPAAARSSCVSCAFMPSAAQAKRCAVGCLPKLRRTWCSPSRDVVSNGRRSKCTRSYNNVCSGCATSPYYAKCVECALKQPGSSDCSACTALKPGLQLKCLNCAAKSFAEFSPCTDCLQFGDKAGKCFKCAQDPKVSYEAKSWCMGCSNWYSTSAKQNKCHACLRSSHKDYFTACTKL